VTLCNYDSRYILTPITITTRPVVTSLYNSQYCVTYKSYSRRCYYSYYITHLSAIESCICRSVIRACFSVYRCFVLMMMIMTWLSKTYFEKQSCCYFLFIISNSYIVNEMLKLNRKHVKGSNGTWGCCCRMYMEYVEHIVTVEYI